MGQIRRLVLWENQIVEVEQINSSKQDHTPVSEANYCVHYENNL